MSTGALTSEKVLIAVRAARMPAVTRALAGVADEPRTLARVLSTVNYEALSADDLFEFARSRRLSLGIDADKNKLVIAELRTALAFEAETGLTLARNPTAGSDWVRGSLTYDALGPFGRGFDIEWANGGVQDQLLEHLVSYDVVILDVVDLDSSQLGILFEYVDSLGDTSDVLQIVEGLPG